MEQHIEEIVTLLDKKKLMFTEYEAATDALIEAADIDVMEDYITKRSDLANKIDDLDDRIVKLLTDAFGETGKLVLMPSSTHENLPQELWAACDCNLSILDIARRIRLKNADITAEYQRRREELSEKIKATSNMPKINKYLNNLSSPTEINNFGLV